MTGGLLHLLHCPLLSLNRGHVPLHLGGKQSPQGTAHNSSLVHGPREGLIRAKPRWDLDSPDRAVKHTPMQRALFSSPLLSVSLLLSAGWIVSDVFFSAPAWGEHPSPPHGLAKLHPAPTPISLGAPDTSSARAFHPAASAATYSPTAPQGLGPGCPSQGSPPAWDAGAEPPTGG